VDLRHPFVEKNPKKGKKKLGQNAGDVPAIGKRKGWQKRGTGPVGDAPNKLFKKEECEGRKVASKGTFAGQRETEKSRKQRI